MKLTNQPTAAPAPATAGPAVADIPAAPAAPLDKESDKYLCSVPND